jgi:2-dehydropantoate 2-reductase
LKYLIVGTGGTGACIGSFLAKKGHDVTFIARGKHLQAIHEKGLTIKSDRIAPFNLKPVKAMTTEEYIQSNEKPDVIFIAVKGYALEDIIPLLAKISDENTIIIPILNIYGTGYKLAKKLPHTNVIEGCIYIVAYISAPGEITQKGKIFRIVFGTRGQSPLKPKLEQIATDLENSDISVVLSENIADDTFRKFVLISPYASCGAYFDIPAGVMQKPGKEQDLFIALTKDCINLAQAYNINIPTNSIDINLKTLNAMTPDTTASMQKDLQKGSQSEIDGLIFEVVRMAKAKNISVPAYELVAKHFGFIA